MIQQFDYFDYAAHEALHLSQKEEGIMVRIMGLIEQEYHSPIDGFSKRIIISQLESLLTYADRFYQRQFVTREMTNHHLVDQLDNLLSTHFKDQNLLANGAPSVQYVSDSLTLSPNYLSRLLRTLTGKIWCSPIVGQVLGQSKLVPFRN